MISRKFTEMWEAWDAFWFQAEGVERMTLFRRLAAMLMLSSYVVRSIDLELYFGESGVARMAVLPEIMDSKYKLSLLTLFPGDTAMWVINGIFLVALFLLVIGIWPRWASVVAAVIHISFLHRNPSAGYGVDTIVSFYFLYFALADWKPGTLWTSMAYRLCQVQVCIIYAYAGVHKLKGTLWWKGEALWTALANWQLARWDFSWAAHVPILLIIATFATLLWEVYFPVLIWIKPIRPWMLFFGALFHLGIALALNIPIFAALMVFTYVLFFKEGTAARMNRRLESVFLFRKVPVTNADTVIV